MPVTWCLARSQLWAVAAPDGQVPTAGKRANCGNSNRRPAAKPGEPIMRRDWATCMNTVMQLLAETAVDERGREMLPDEGFRSLAEKMTLTRHNRNRVFLIGNGPGASLASHFAAELARNAQVLTEVFNDSVNLSAIANEMGYEWVFAEPLRRRARKGDVLICFGSSGRAPNLQKAVDFANRLEVCTVTLSAFEPDNPLRQMGVLNFYVAAKTHSDTDSCHHILMHHASSLVMVEESKTVEIQYQKLFTEMGRPPAQRTYNPDSAFFLP